MTPSARVPTGRLSLCLSLCAATLLAALTAHAEPPATLFMRIDGVKGQHPAKQPLGADAFALANFGVSTDGEPGKPGDTTSGERFTELTFTLPISGPAVALWQLAALGSEVPKASLVAVDPATGATRYRIDLERVVVRTLSLQTRGARDAAIGSLEYQRIRIHAGEGDEGASASWNRATNAPWK